MPLDLGTIEVKEVLAQLRLGRSRVLEHGWCQHVLVDFKGRVCLVGALTMDGEKRNKAIGALSAALPINSRYISNKPDLCVFEFNDAPLRTVDDIIALFDRAIEMASAQVAAHSH